MNAFLEFFPLSSNPTLKGFTFFFTYPVLMAKNTFLRKY